MLLPLVLALTAAPRMDLYIGTYTSPNGSRGIYHAQLDPKTGTLSEPDLAAEAPSPSFLALHPSGRFLYAVHESTNGDVAAYAIGADKKLTHLNTQTSNGGGPCHVSVDGAGKYLFTANYGGGSFAAFLLHRDGQIVSPTCVIQDSGTGPNKARQEGPHGHAIQPDATGRNVYACDLGTDEILNYRLNPKDGILFPGTPRAIKAHPGSGPRHLALHPNGKLLFVNGEMSNTVTSYRIEGGTLKEIDTLSTLPEGEPIKGRSTAEIALHPNGKWLYVSNRGHDSIAAYAVSKEGKLTLIEIESAGVREPRGFAIDPTGHWLVVGGQNSNDLTTLALDPSTGRLTPTGHKVQIAKPVCVIFA